MQACKLLKNVELKCLLRMTDAALLALAESCTNLHSLVFFHCPSVNNGLVTVFQRCSNLQELDVDYDPVTFVGINHYCKDLQKLSTGSLDDEDLRNLALHNTRLYSLKIDGTLFSARGLRHLASGCTCLEVLSVDTENLSVEDIAHFAELPSLRYLVLQVTQAKFNEVDSAVEELKWQRLNLKVQLRCASFTVDR